jgi:hypothetical protein
LPTAATGRISRELGEATAPESESSRKSSSSAESAWGRRRTRRAFVGGYSDYVPSDLGYGRGYVGLVVLIVLPVLPFR